MAGSFFQTKGAARQAVEAVRRSLSSRQVSEWGGEVHRHLAALGFLRPPLTVASYWAQGFEVPTAALEQLLGLRVCYPAVMPGSRVLAFRACSAADLVPARMGLREPPATAPAVGPRDIDVWLVPGVAFTTTGERLGRGGGYYDATLSCARSDAPLVGLSFECCVIGGWPAEAHDVKVKWLITERAASRCEPLTPFISG